MTLVPFLMLLMMRQPLLHHPWRLSRCNPFSNHVYTFRHLTGTPGAFWLPGMPNK